MPTGQDEEYTQANRLISIDTPLGEDVLLLQTLSGYEGISRLFNFELEMLAHQNDSIAFKDIVGQNVTISIQLADGSPRNINGIVSRFAQGGTDERYFTRYHAEAVPWLWFLTRQSDCRIFQNLTPPEIISQVFGLFSFADFRLSLQATYPKLEYCVQYRETAFNFVSRLMEEYGIFYYFDHSTQGKHTMVLADNNSGLDPCLSPLATYDVFAKGLEESEVVTGWHIQQELRTGKYSLTDYNFTTPKTSLLTNAETVVDISASKPLELYDYPALVDTKDQGETMTRLRMEEEETSYLVASGSSFCRGFASGYQFTLDRHYRDDQNDTYILTEVFHSASAGETYTAGKDETQSYSNRFRCIPMEVTYRPVRLTPKPFVQGPQPALVVGKQGEEIWTDSYGRVKVQFYWDRVGKNDEKSSCWLRVSQPWAGKGWGSIWIPRIGQEVIVSFLEGDPDRPFISGRVYNADQTVPYKLPDNQTRSTFMSRSSKGGGASNYNELRFEDKKGDEQIFMNAEKDMDLRVEKESREFVGANRHLIVTTNQQELVNADKHGHVKGSHFEKIEGDMSLQVGGKQMEKTTGDKSVEVDGAHKEKIVGDHSLQVGGSQNAQVGGSVSLQVGQSRNEQVGQTHAMEAGQTIHLQAGMTVIIEAGMQLSLKGPGGFVDIGPAGVTIQGTMVLINSGGAAGSGPGANTQSPQSPDAPQAPKDPDTADDGSKGGKLN